MALSTFIKNASCGVLKLIDNSGTTLTIPYEKGDLSVSGLGRLLNETVTYQSRGLHKGAGIGERRYPSGTFSAWITEFTNASAGVLSDFLLKRGGYSTVSTLGTSHPIDGFHLEWVVEGTNFGDDADQTLRFESCNFTWDVNDAMDGASMSLSFMVLGRVLLNGTAIMAERS